MKYKWGGKHYSGVDCSGLIQLFLNFNNKFCPRDAKDQMKYFKKKIKLKNVKKNDLIFWKGHVAVITSKNRLKGWNERETRLGLTLFSETEIHPNLVLKDIIFSITISVVFN